MIFFDKVPFAVTICDAEGKILEMNEKSRETFDKHGNLIGKSLFDCHKGASAEKLRQLLENHEMNIYTIEKHERKKLILQTPWYNANGAFGGYIEISFVLPENIPHYIRQ